MTQPTTTPEKTPPRGRGRPAMPPGAGRNARIEWRTTQERREKAQRLADAAGVTLAAWLDRRIDSAR